MGHHRLAVLPADREGELVLHEAEGEGVGALASGNGEVVLLQDVEDRDGALVLLIGIAPADGILVEGHRREAVDGRRFLCRLSRFWLF